MPKSQIGVIGLGVMGQNLVLNMIDKGYTVSIYNRTPKRTIEFMQSNKDVDAITATYSLDEFIASLDSPRKIQFIFLNRR